MKSTEFMNSNQIIQFILVENYHYATGLCYDRTCIQCVFVCSCLQRVVIVNKMKSMYET